MFWVGGGVRGSTASRGGEGVRSRGRSSTRGRLKDLKLIVKRAAMREWTFALRGTDCAAGGGG